VDFEHSSAHRDLRQKVRRFVDQDVLPAIVKYEEKSIFPMEIFREMGRQGFLKAHVAKEHGGLGLGVLGYCIVSEEVSRAGAGMTHNGHFQLGNMLFEHGKPEQQQKCLQKLFNGEYAGAMAITEPGAGSSFVNLSTTVKEKEGVYILDGVKTLINDAAEADVMGVFARSNGGFTMLLLYKGTRGFRITKKLDPMGFRSSPVYEFEMKGCRVGPENVLGALNEGIKLFFSAFNLSRLGNASAALGIGSAAFNKTLDYVRDRRVGAHRVADFQGIRWRLAELSVELEAARLLRDKAAVMADNGKEGSLEASQAKLFCVQMCNKVVGECVQMTGGYGCLRDSLFELYLRDARVLGTAGGSLEVMRNNIAKRVIGG
jgi:alkylation response protein AidB-like acyl-CoA dehydrogenase